MVTVPCSATPGGGMVNVGEGDIVSLIETTSLGALEICSVVTAEVSKFSCRPLAEFSRVSPLTFR